MIHDEAYRITIDDNIHTDAEIHHVVFKIALIVGLASFSAKVVFVSPLDEVINAGKKACAVELRYNQEMRDEKNV